jgi:hypothetical protein
MIVLDKDKLAQLGNRLRTKFDLFAAERRQLELQWLKNLRQYKGIYDPKTRALLEGKSKVYPKDTHTKITGWVAKMMEMMFPAQDKNWSLDITPFPDIAIEDLDQIIAGLEAQQEAAAEEGSEPEPVTSEMIEEAVKEFSKVRAERMTMECEDQLADSRLDYPELCKKVMRRGGIYGYGVAEGPLVSTVNSREWAPDPDNPGKFKAVIGKVKRPYYIPRQVWDIYPDLSAPKWEDQEGLFSRTVLPRHELNGLAARKDFIGETIREYLANSAGGNYKPRGFESELNAIKHISNSTPDMSRQYEVIRYYGYLSAQDLKDIGADVPDTALGKDILADVWLLDNTPIKADTAPFGEKVSDMFHAFIPEEDEDGPLTGTAKVEVLRDSQLKLCAIDRATMDNMAACCRSIVEVNEDLLLAESQGMQITGGATIRRGGEGAEANYPAVRTYDIPSHIPELLNLRKAVLEVFDVESNLPSWRMGDAKPLGEAFRTTNNMSMMASGGDMVTKDDVRSFDRFVKSFIGSLVRWNMEFNPKDDIKGDFSVMPKGNLSLVAKEVRGAALLQMKQALTPRQAALIDDEAFLIEEFLTRDLPRRLVKTGKEAAAALTAFDEQQARATEIQQGVELSKTAKQNADAAKSQASAEETAALVEAKVNEILSSIAEKLAKAKGVKDGTALQSVKLLLDATKPEGKGAGAGKPAQGKAAK